MGHKWDKRSPFLGPPFFVFFVNSVSKILKFPHSENSTFSKFQNSQTSKFQTPKSQLRNFKTPSPAALRCSPLQPGWRSCM